MLVNWLVSWLLSWCVLAPLLLSCGRRGKTQHSHCKAIPDPWQTMASLSQSIPQVSSIHQPIQTISKVLPNISNQVHGQRHNNLVHIVTTWYHTSWFTSDYHTYAVPYVGTGPDMPNIHNTLTSIGHRFGHQLGLDESSRRNSTTYLLGVTSHGYVMFSEINIIIIIANNEEIVLWKTTLVEKACR